jgi:hypothetical protein
MSRTAVISKLHEIADHYLFGEGTWPADRESLTAFFRILRQLGLDEEVPGHLRTTRFTSLGKELKVQLIMAFVGAWELYEIPEILESLGYMDEAEVDALRSMSEPKFVRALQRYLLRAYFEFYNRTRLLN